MLTSHTMLYALFSFQVETVRNVDTELNSGGCITISSDGFVEPQILEAVDDSHVNQEVIGSVDSIPLLQLVHQLLRYVMLPSRAFPNLILLA
jgi:hypothetical protein